MLTFVAYVLTPAIVLGAGFGAYYMYDPEAAHLTAIQWTWNAIYCYVKLTDYFKTPVKKIQKKRPKDTADEKSNIINHNLQHHNKLINNYAFLNKTSYKL